MDAGTSTGRWSAGIPTSNCSAKVTAASAARSVNHCSFQPRALKIFVLTFFAWIGSTSANGGVWTSDWRPLETPLVRRQEDVDGVHRKDVGLRWLQKLQESFDVLDRPGETVASLVDSPSARLLPSNRIKWNATNMSRATKNFTRREESSSHVGRLLSVENEANVGGRTPEQRLPQAIIVGVKKCGTRALLEFLRAHPDVRAPGPEIHFFDKNYDLGPEWYRRQMPATYADQLTLEKTPSYFVTRDVAARIHNMSSNVRLIVVVRDPVTRAVSDYTQAIAKRPDLGSFESRAFVDNASTVVDTSWGAIRIGFYARHLEPWLKRFPRGQIHFVHGERLISDPAGQMKQVQEFLGIRPLISEQNFYFSATKRFPCLIKFKRNSGGGGLKKRRETAMSGGIPHCLGKSKGRQHPAVNPTALQRLRQFYRPFNLKFYQMTGIDFGWP